MLTQLDVVNAQLASMGEAPLTSLAIPHPYVAAGLNALRKASRQTQAVGWWFNVGEYDLVPDPEAEYVITGQLPCGVLAIRAPYGMALSLRGEKLYDHIEQATRTRAVYGVRVTYELPFEELPPTAQQYVCDKAVLDFQKAYDASDSRTRLCQQDVAASYVIMNQEHIRTIKMNKFRNPTTAEAILATRGGYNMHGLPTRNVR